MKDRWKTRTTLLMMVVVFLFSAAPSFHNTHESHWKEYEAKYAAPFTPSIHASNNGSEHAAKLDLRLTVPILAYVLGFHKNGTYILLGICALFVCLLTPRLFLKATEGNNEIAFWLSMAVAGGHLLTLFYRPLTGYFDGVALTLVLFCFCAQNKGLQFILAIMALFADERAIFGVAMAVLFHALLFSVHTKKECKFLFLSSLPFLFAVVTWILLRFIAMHLFLLKAPLGGVGFCALSANYNLFPTAFWEVFQGGWGIVVLGLCLLFPKRPITCLAAISFSILGLAGAALVLDLTRSATYVFPVIFIAAIGLRFPGYGSIPLTICIACSILAILEPNLDIIGPACSAYFVWSKPIWITLPMDIWYFLKVI